MGGGFHVKYCTLGRFSNSEVTLNVRQALRQSFVSELSAVLLSMSSSLLIFVFLDLFLFLHFFHSHGLFIYFFFVVAKYLPIINFKNVR